MQSPKRCRKDCEKRNVSKKYDILLKHRFNMDEAQRQLLVCCRKKGTNSKQQKLRCENFEKTSKTVYSWFISKRSQRISSRICKIFKRDKNLGKR